MNQQGTRFWPARKPGFALVLVLAMLVLVAGLVTAYFSRALQESRTSTNSQAGKTVGILTISATEMILNDLAGEMRAGSVVEEESGVRVLRPRLIHTEGAEAGEGVPLAPSMAIQHADQLTDFPTVAKISRGGWPFYEERVGYVGGDGPARASVVGTETPSLNGRFIPRNDWNLPRLMTSDEFNGAGDGSAFASPDWIYLNRDGRTEAPAPDQMETLRDSAPDNPDFVLGRFAYVIYEVGGLLDVNVAGNTLDPETNRHRGSQHQVSLASGIGEVEWEAFNHFVEDWRWPDWADDAAELFDPAQGFLEVAPGQQALVTRQDLILHAAGADNRIPENILPFLTVYSRTVDAPHWRPDPERPKLPPDPDPDDLNPDFATIRFSETTTLERGSDPPLMVPTGTPVMPRRFPLHKLNMFNERDDDHAIPASADSLEYYFGLRRVDGRVDTYEYIRTTNDGRIARLDEVAMQGREPNFFEILQAVILTGSLGKTVGHTFTLDMLRDELRNLQVMQIGANIIDQWDSDNVPTTLLFPSGEPGVPVEVHGTENLPYLHQFALVPHRPVYDWDRFQMWTIFDVWNPHQNANALPTDIEAFRIQPVSGEWYRLRPFYVVLGDYAGSLLHTPGTYSRGAEADIVELHNALRDNATGEMDAEWGLHFPSDVAYAEVTTLRGSPPEEEGALPGLLLWDHDLSENPQTGEYLHALANPAVPAKETGWRRPELQIQLNAIYDEAHPYTVEGGALDDYEDGPGGERLYDAGTTFTGLDLQYWAHNQVMVGGETYEAVHAHYATKAHNVIRGTEVSAWSGFESFDEEFFPASEPLNFALQARIDGQWVTYQRIEDYFRRSASQNLRRGEQNISNHTYMRETATHHSELSESEIEGLEESYYQWWPPENYFRIDPRGHRFGFSEGLTNAMGAPLRSDSGFSSDAWLTFRHGVPSNTDPGGTIMGVEHSSAPSGSTGSRKRLGGFMTNSPKPDAPNLNHPARYTDRDGVIRPGDAYFGDGETVLPTVPGRLQDRPLILNRPFRSVADLGYVFRDLPWKTMDFSSRYSGDLGLMDVFSLNEMESRTPLVAGKINLNTRRPEVLEAVLRDTMQRPSDYLEGRHLDEALAAAIADGIVNERLWHPYAYAGDLVARVFDNPELADLLEGIPVKAEREAAMRTLAGLGQTRTWNLMIDVVVQSGRFTQASTEAADFLVEGEQRIWLHVAMDRVTGEVVDIGREVVHP